MKSPMLFLVLLIACSTGRDSLPDGAPLPPDMGLVVGKFDFSKVNWLTRVGIRQIGQSEIVLEPKTLVFGIPVPPGRYKIEYVDDYRSEPEDLHIQVEAGKAVYIGSWYAVLGLDIDLRDESRALAAEIMGRWSLEAHDGMPGEPRRIVFEVDPILAEGPGRFSNGCD
jgi:hypothetical protein